MLGFGILFITLSGVSIASIMRMRQLEEAGVIAGTEDREPIWIALREIAIGVLGIMAGISLLLLLVLLLHVLG